MIVAKDAGNVDWLRLVGRGVATGTQGIPIGIGVVVNGCSAAIYLLAYIITIIRRTVRLMTVSAGQNIIFFLSFIRRFPFFCISFAPAPLPAMNTCGPINIFEIGVAQPGTNR